VTIGADGLGLISYYDATNEDLKVAHCSNAACSSATITTLDSAGDVGKYSSVIIGADGLGLISYYDATNEDLKVAHCSDAACSSATITTLDSAGDVGKYSSVTIGSDGLGLISYSATMTPPLDDTNSNLKVAHCSNAACSGGTITTLASLGTDPSVTIGADGLGLISYYDATNGNLKVAHCSDAACSKATINTDALDSSGNVGRYTSVTIGADGLGLISYYAATNEDLKLVHCSDAACFSVAITTLDSSGNVGRYPSVTIGADGLGLISYYDATNGNLKVAHCSDATCSRVSGALRFASATITTLDSDGDVGKYSSVTIGSDGLGLISYYDATNGNLKVAHCDNFFCTPYFRRR
jgi:hypothetical protein